jgi:hypothetical protein
VGAARLAIAEAGLIRSSGPTFRRSASQSGVDIGSRGCLYFAGATQHIPANLRIAKPSSSGTTSLRRIALSCRF